MTNPQTTAEDVLVTVAETCTQLGLKSRMSFYNLLRQGVFTDITIGTGKRPMRRVRQSEIDALKASGIPTP